MENKSIGKRILKLFGYFILGIFGILIIGVLLFYLNRQTIKEKVIEAVNQEQNGELHIGQIGIAPFEDFPNFTLELDSIAYYEKKAELRKEEARPIAALNKFFVSVDVMALIGGDVKVGAIKLHDGEVNLYAYKDSSLNLTNALGIDLSDTTQVEEVPQDTTQAAPPAFNVQLDKFSLKNVKVIVYNQMTDKGLGVQVKNIKTSLTYNENIISNKLKVNVELLGIKDKEKLLWQNKHLEMKTNLTFDRVKKIIDIKKCDFDIEGAVFALNGTVDIPNDLTLDLNLTASQKDLNIINLLANGKMDMDKIKSEYTSTLGGLEFDAKITGKSKATLPKVVANVALDKFTLKSLKTPYGLNDFSFQASLNTGDSADLSQLEFHLNKFNIETTNGFTRGDLSVTNGIEKPHVDLNWEADLSLENFDDLLTGIPFDSLGGKLAFKADVNYDIDVKKKKFIQSGRNSQKIYLKLSDGHVRHIPTGMSPRDINATLYIWENHVGIKDFMAKVDGSDFKFNGNIDNLIFYALGIQTPIKADVRLQSNHLLVRELLEYTDSAAIDLADNLHDIDIDFTMETDSKSLNDYKILPYGKLTINNLQTSFDKFQSIHNVSGLMGITPKALGIDHLKGNIGESDFYFRGGFDNYDGIVYKDSAITIKAGFDIRSNSMRVVDFFTYGDSLLVPKSFKNEKMNNFQIQGGIDVVNQELFSDKKVPDFKVWMKGLKWRLSITPLLFRDFRFELVKKDKDVYLNDFKGKIGQSDMTFNAQLLNVLDSTRKDFKGQFQVDAKLINFNELLKLTLPEETYEQSSASRSQQIQEEEPVDIFAIKYPELELDIKVNTMKLMDMNIKNFDGKVSTTTDQKVVLNGVSVQLGDVGSMKMSGVADTQNPKNVILEGDATLTNVDLSKIDFEVEYEGDKINMAENFDGILNANMKAKTHINNDLSVDIAHTTADIKMTLSDGRIVNFGPLEAMARYFGNKDMSNIRFDKIENNFTVKDGVFYIPRMDIASTIGQLYISGEQHLNMDMKYMVEVPFKLVRSVAWNTLTGGKKKKDDEEDEIQKDEGGKYVAVRIEGNIDDYDIKLGKGKKNKGK
ncbi:AsmA-like C-terminal region-containing protein [Flammeovirga yaeyamensis]|uniref:AsmA-like C-terminal region-containing protein n=1 Tax=Flammeovirga yaeyamensis TaxID=367791 RepID=A0AAX1N5E5_9BACT|nr:AsmA-like C-terminal region-containing protein [Flammeovirga yaeyamensis]MBB3701482.1 type 1 fimbria pilin [Flammeovirga yaeyamensis]NMF38606.1 AsmA-like C-terminal region-containing protein [Flammeovirga yaeyamensis]QWG02731.1 AsmA-like C-terminal region-containing protein [Flammeovirga yaeyamensis]